MTSKDFKRMAAHVASIKDRELAWKIAYHFAVVAGESNPRFDLVRFYNACGVTEQKMN